MINPIVFNYKEQYRDILISYLDHEALKKNALWYFGYLNGDARINTENHKAQGLEIVIYLDPMPPYAELENRQTVLINLTRMIIECSDFEFSYNITSDLANLLQNLQIQMIYTIVHELFHAGQYYDHSQLTDPDRYRTEVEEPVIYMTNLFMIDNSSELQSVFGIDLAKYLEIFWFKVNSIKNRNYIRK